MNRATAGRRVRSIKRRTYRRPQKTQRGGATRPQPQLQFLAKQAQLRKAAKERAAKEMEGVPKLKYNLTEIPQGDRGGETPAKMWIGEDRIVKEEALKEEDTELLTLLTQSHPPTRMDDNPSEKFESAYTQGGTGPPNVCNSVIDFGPSDKYPQLKNDSVTMMKMGQGQETRIMLDLKGNFDFCKKGFCPFAAVVEGTPNSSLSRESSLSSLSRASGLLARGISRFAGHPGKSMYGSIKDMFSNTGFFLYNSALVEIEDKSYTDLLQLIEFMSNNERMDYSVLLAVLTNECRWRPPPSLDAGSAASGPSPDAGLAASGPDPDAAAGPSELDPQNAFWNIMNGVTVTGKQS